MFTQNTYSKIWFEANCCHTNDNNIIVVVYTLHTTCRINAMAVPAIPSAGTGAAELIAKAKAVAQVDIRASVNMKKKNFPASGSNPM